MQIVILDSLKQFAQEIQPFSEYIENNLKFSNYLNGN